VSGSEPSREELLALVEAQAATIAQLQATAIALQAEVTELKRQLGRNSGNSSQPPSADGPAVPNRAARRRAGRDKTRKPGKQPGAGGTTLGVVAEPDEIIDHTPGTCGGCGADLDETDAAATAGATAGAVIRRQVHDIPDPAQIATRVTEHRLHQRRCRCGHRTRAQAPAGVNAPASYGPNLRALAAYLLVYQHIPVARTAELIADLTGARPSTGWVSSTLEPTAAAVAPANAVILDEIRAAPVVHVDETSSNINGARWWLHVASTPTLTAFHLHPSRGRVAITEFDVLPNYRGTLVHDSLTLYDTYTQARHALCGAHLVRELTAAAEAHPERIWPEQAIRVLHQLNTAAHQARDQGLSQITPEIADPLVRSFRHAVIVGLAEHPRRPGARQPPTRNLLQRLGARVEQVLLFARDLAVPFTNNQAERDLRPTKTQLKISGCHRSATTARAWLAIRGYISTARKHGRNAYQALRDAITGNPWTPQTA
jgi:transposase